MQQKGFAAVLALIVLVLGISTAGLAFYLNRPKQAMSPTPIPVTPTPQAQAAKEPDMVLPTISYSKIKGELINVLAEKIKYPEGQNAPYRFTDGSVDISVFKYKKGESILSEGYEGAGWETNLDDEVNQLNSLKFGKQQALSCASFGPCGKTQVTYQKLGGRNWASIEYGFQPSITWHKVYYTFDASTQQIIYVYLMYGPIFGGDINAGVYNVYPEIKQQLEKFEQEVLSL